MRIEEGHDMRQIYSRLFLTFFYILLFLVMVGLSSCGGGSSSSSSPSEQKKLASITITPSNPAIAAGASQQFIATGTFSDGTTQDLTGQVAWTSFFISVATITQNGMVSAIAVGQTSISATLGDVSGSTALTVPATTPMLVSITITPSSSTIVAGTTQQFSATGTFSDGTTQDLTSQVSWSSSVDSNTSIVKNGIYTIIAGGSSTITAELGGITGTATLMVTPP